MKNKKIVSTLITALVLSSLSFADVVQHEKDFGINVSSNDDIHYFGKLMDWSYWLQSGRQDYVSIDKNPIYTAIKENHSSREINPPSLSELESSIGKTAAVDLNDIISKREDLDLGKVKEKSAYIYNSKISSLVSRSINDFDLSEDEYLGLLNQIDAPHKHTKISKDFAHNLLEPVHSGHKKLGEEGIAVYSLVGFFDYGCDFLLNSLAALSEILGEEVRRITDENGKETPAFNIHLVSTLKRLNDSELEESKKIFDEKPDIVFVQETIYSNFLIRSGKNYWAFFDKGDEGTRIINYSTYALSSKTKNIKKPLIYGVSLSTIADPVGKVSETKDGLDNRANDLIAKLKAGFSKAEGANENDDSAIKNSDIKDLIINDNWVDLSKFNPEDRSCSKGLGLGIPGYTLENYKKLININR